MRKKITLLQSAFSLYFPCMSRALLVKVLSVSFKILNRNTQPPLIFQSVCEILAL